MLGDTILERLNRLEINEEIKDGYDGFAYCELSINLSDMILHETSVLNGDVGLLISDTKTNYSYLLESNTNNLKEFTVKKRLDYNFRTRNHDVSDVIFAKTLNGDYAIRDHEDNIWCFDKDHNLIDPEQNYEEFEQAILYMKLKEMI
ncbi:hypothetical protein [Gluconobacter frateurii]|uniref:Uncharacterized protein n=1 Tax=Gluconobacter frateurii NRIC 0228 TaxID=1307946 RepID=A0ABQ0QFS0_9PROT|nr:hypothetical protein [Gluconobacter frateurii]GBR17500.1 hypothetical protein AA0228_3043 [Gluconobacter frateurii NRIC 0228]GLP89621.1 hypothetical protein GCM10007868_06960 [Gluconobacter frateurii]